MSGSGVKLAASLVLPLELEDDVRSVLKGVVGAVDPDTGELP